MCKFLGVKTKKKKKKNTKLCIRMEVICGLIGCKIRSVKNVKIRNWIEISMHSEMVSGNLLVEFSRRLTIEDQNHCIYET